MMIGAALAGAVAASLAPQDAQAVEQREVLKGDFRKYFDSNAPRKPYIYGRHTESLIQELQAASFAIEQGESQYLIINVPFRHGKSDVASRRFPAWHLTRLPDHEVILASYGFDLARELAYDARKCFSETGPMFGLFLSQDRRKVASWRVRNHAGGMYAAGLGGTITGRGAHVLIIDDYLKNRIEAESELQRDKIWASFQNDLMTRLAPVHAVIIVANRWHEDDLVGRIQNRNNPDHEEYDERFPKFKVLEFPAQAEDGSWLFPERFSDQWYQTVKATLGEYAWSALGLQDPRPRKGRMLQVENVHYVDKMPEGLNWRRGWDLASSEKERFSSDNPDYTVGTKSAYQDGILYVADVVRGQWTAGRRDRQMLLAANDDGMDCVVKIESVGGYKDTYVHIKNHLSGKAVVRKFVPPPGDKVARASILEPLFEAGKVYVLKAPWNERWERELAGFPGGAKKDDQVDSLVISVYDELINAGRMGFTR